MTLKRFTAFLAAITIGCTAFGHYPVCRRSAGAETPSVRDFADSVLPLLCNPDGTKFESLYYSKSDHTLSRDGDAVPGDTYSGFRVIDGELRIAASETVRAGETAETGFLTLEEAAPLIGLETYETDDGVYISDPFRSGVLIVKSDNLSDTKGASEVGNGWNDLHVLQYQTAADAYQAYQSYQNDDTVIFAEPNRVYHIADDSQADSSGYVFPADNWGWSAVGADNFLTLYEENAASYPTVVAAVLDTGLYAEHDWFQNRTAEGGASFIAGDNSAYTDPHGHGTHCSGIICGMTPENVQILPLKVMDASGYGETLGIYCGMLYAAEQHADVISMSLGGIGYSPMFEEAVRVLSEQEIPCVVAAGNDSIDAKYFAPACISDAITVSSVCDTSLSNDLPDANGEPVREREYQLSGFSNYGSVIDFCAPGEVILSASNYGTDAVIEMSGTSMACPHVTGCVADILTLQNDYTIDEVYTCLQNNAADLGESGYDESFGWGMVNLNALDFSNSPLAMPEVSCGSGTYTKVFSVTLSTAEPDAGIRYTLDGTYPSADTGILYQGEEILIDDATNLIAVTVKDGNRSRYACWHYAFSSDAPEMYPTTGHFQDSVMVSLTYPVYGFDVYYTLDGSDPSPENGRKYTAPIVIYQTTLLKAAVVIGKYVGPLCVNYYEINEEKSKLIFETDGTTLTRYYGNDPDVNLCDYFEPGEITEIGENVFRNNPVLENVVLPEGVVSIGAYAFDRCYALRTVTAPDVTEIGEHAFDWATNLETLDMPSLKTIGAWAFAGAFCEMGTPFAEDNRIESIGFSAFYMSNLVNAVFPNLKALEGSAFNSCSQLETAVLSSDITVLPEQAFDGCCELVSLDAPGVTELKFCALNVDESHAPKLSSCTIDFSRVTSIESQALSMFANWPVPMESVSFDSLTEITEYSFLGFPAIKLCLPNVRHIPAYAFYGVGSSGVYLEQAESLDYEALIMNRKSAEPAVFVFGDHVKDKQKNPLIQDSTDVVIAAAANSPMIGYAQAANNQYYCTPDIYVPSAFESVSQYETVLLNDCVPLAFGCSLRFAVTDSELDAPYQETEELFFTDDSEELTFLNTSVTGTVTVQADLLNADGTVVKTRTFDIRIMPVSEQDIITEEGVFVLEWEKGTIFSDESDPLLGYGMEKSKYDFVFRPEEAGEYYFLQETPGYELKVYSNRSGLLTFVSDWQMYEEQKVRPVKLKAGEAVRITAKTTEPYRYIDPFAGILITKNQPTCAIGDYSADMEQYVFKKGEEHPSLENIEVTYSFAAYDDGFKRVLKQDVDYQCYYTENESSGAYYLFGIGDYRGTLNVQVYYYEDLPLGETINLPEMQSGQMLCYHITNPDSTRAYLVGAEYSDTFLQLYAAGKTQPNITEKSIHLSMQTAGMQYVYPAEYFDELISNEVFTLQSGKDYYMILSAESDAPAGMYTLYTKEYDSQHWMGSCEYTCEGMLEYNGTRQEIVGPIRDEAGNLLQEGRDYELYLRNNSIPGSVTGFIRGIGDYYGMLSVMSEILIPFSGEMVCQPEQISPNEPFTLAQDCDVFELNLEDSFKGRFRRTDTSDPDASYIYCINTYFADWNCWFMVGEGGSADEDAELELEPGLYQIYIAKQGADQEFILELDAMRIGIGNAEVQTAPLIYTGDSLYPEFTLTYNGTELTENVDYELVISTYPIIECGVYPVHIIGIGDFCGETTVQIVVTKDDLSSLPEVAEGDNTVSVTEPGANICYEWTPDKSHYGIRTFELQLFSLYIYDKEENRAVTSLYGCGYLYDFFDVTPGRTYTVFVSYESNEVTGEINFTLLSEYIDLTACVVDGPSQIAFTEERTLPAFNVMNGDTLLQKDTDYRIAFSGGSHEPGHALISLDGTGDCIGTLTYHYYVYPEMTPESFEEDLNLRNLWLNCIESDQIPMPGDMQCYEFKAPEDGWYTFERPDPETSGVCIFAYGPDCEILPLQITRAELQKGEKLWFIVVSDHLEYYGEEETAYSLMVQQGNPPHSIYTEDGMYVIDLSGAYLDEYFGDNTGILLPQTVYDTETGTEVPVVGCTSSLLDEIGMNKTFYCEDADLLQTLLLQIGMCAAVTDPRTGIRGDITGDGTVSTDDYLTLMRWMTECPGMMMSDAAYAVSDYNEDGILDLLDAEAIRNAAQAQ